MGRSERARQPVGQAPDPLLVLFGGGRPLMGRAGAWLASLVDRLIDMAPPTVIVASWSVVGWLLDGVIGALVGASAGAGGAIVIFVLVSRSWDGSVAVRPPAETAHHSLGGQR